MRQQSGVARSVLVLAAVAILALVVGAGYMLLNTGNGATGGDFNGVPVYSSLSRVDLPQSTTDTLVRTFGLDSQIVQPKVALYTIDGGTNNVLSFYRTQLAKDNWTVANSSETRGTLSVYTKSDTSVAYLASAPLSASALKDAGLSGKVGTDQNLFMLAVGAPKHPGDQDSTTGR